MNIPPKRRARSGVKATPGMPLEKDIQREIVKHLKDSGWEVMVIRERFAGRPSDPGIPDVVAIKSGRTMWLEVKRPNGIVRKTQVKRHKDMRSQGAEVYVVRSIEDVRAAIKYPGLYLP